MRLLPATILALAVVGCEAGQPRSSNETVDRARRALRDGEFVLDARGDGAMLVARQLPTPPDTDSPRRLLVRWILANGVRELGTEQRPIADAKLVDGGIVVLRLPGDLERLGDDGRTTIIDHEAWGPLSVRAGKVAYVRGEAPELEVALADVEHAVPAVLTKGWAPTWCPAIAEDGSVVFMSGRSSAPELARVKLGEPPRRLATWQQVPQALPEGPFAPVVVGGDLVFEVGGALRVLSFDGRLRRSIPGMHAPVSVQGKGVLLVHGAQPSMLETLPLTEVTAP